VSQTLEKVTVFVTRPAVRGPELLLFEHPNAGIQIPAGTLEQGERPEQAALREAYEETGLSASLLRRIGQQETRLPPDQRVVLCATPVYARPDPGSFDWARLRRGISVRVERSQPGWVQVTYAEGDRYPDPAYTTYQITGWVPEETLAEALLRHFYHLSVPAGGPDRWQQPADNHLFRPFWAPLDNLPGIVPPQQAWLEYVNEVLGYKF
jgi:8-oxo-dGTP pyrophosphatase MutT (NUDIX family)